jgi:hypothetical protein
LFSFYYSREGNGTKTRRKKKQMATTTSVFFFFFFFVVAQSHLLVSFCYASIVVKKKKTITSVTFFDGFVARNWRLAPFFGGFAPKKVTTIMLSPSSMALVM